MTSIVPPDERTCEECGRTDRWDDDIEGDVESRLEDLGYLS